MFELMRGELEMETFADYILGEKDYIKKMEIIYYLQKRTGIFSCPFISTRKRPIKNHLNIFFKKAYNFIQVTLS